MQLDEAYKAVTQHFLSEWAGATPVVFGNESATEPPPPWVRVSMRPNVRKQETVGGVGNKIFESRESVYVQIFVASDTGDRQLRELQQQVLDVFEGLSLAVAVASGAVESVDFFDAEPSRGEDEPHLLVGIVEAQCRFQERK